MVHMILWQFNAVHSRPIWIPIPLRTILLIFSDILHLSSLRFARGFPNKISYVSYFFCQCYISCPYSFNHFFNIRKSRPINTQIHYSVILFISLQSEYFRFHFVFWYLLFMFFPLGKITLHNHTETTDRIRIIGSYSLNFTFWKWDKMVAVSDLNHNTTQYY
jgi:hypothetical protein